MPIFLDQETHSIISKAGSTHSQTSLSTLWRTVATFHPPISKRTTGTGQLYTESHLEQLEVGYTMFRGDEFPDEELAAAWQMIGSALLERHGEVFPGSRSWYWWYTQSDRRQRIDGGTHPHDQPGRTIPKRLSYGVPRALQTRDDFSAQDETQTVFLARHKLLSRGEAAALASEEEEYCETCGVERWDAMREYGEPRLCRHQIAELAEELGL